MKSILNLVTIILIVILMPGYCNTNAWIAVDHAAGDEHQTEPLPSPEL